MLKRDLEFIMATHANFSTHQTKLVTALLCQISQERESLSVKREVAWVPRFGEKRNKIRGKKSCE
jgi:hypothetical protein